MVVFFLDTEGILERQKINDILYLHFIQITVVDVYYQPSNSQLSL